MFQGSFVALVTPFKENFDVDFDAYGRLIDFHLEQGTNGIVPCGCTGEAATLTHEEQKECIRFTMERVAGRVPVVAGTGSNNTREAVELSRCADELKCDGTLSITPYYNKPTQEGLVAHFTAIAESISIPVMLYNVPGRTGTRIEPETIARLSKVPNIASIKEACGSVDQVSQILSLCDINVVSGDDSLTLPMIAVGGTGVVSVAANVAPKLVAELCAKANAGDFEAARQVHYKLMPLFKGLFLETNPIPVKALLAEMGLIKNILRMPLISASTGTQARVRAIATDIGLM